jgi:phosphonoacetaldehyde methylase
MFIDAPEIRPDPTLRENVRRVLLMSPPGKVTVSPEGSVEQKLAVPPLGLAYLAASLRKNGYEVRILDVMVEGYWQDRTTESGAIIYGLEDEEVRNRIAAFDPDMIGVSCLFSNRGSEALALCALAKSVAPDAHLVFGGQHPTGMPQLVLDENVDYILYGEADNSLVRLIETINAGGNLSDVPQIVLKNGTNFWRSPENDYPDPRELPDPAWDLVNIEKYWAADMPLYGLPNQKREKFLVMISTRGCPHNCYFCTAPMMTDRRFRVREIEDVIDEIQRNKDEYGLNRVYFWDDNFFINKKRTKRLLRAMIDAFPDIKFECPSGAEANALDDEVVDLLADAGFTRLQLPVESATEEVQEARVDKKVDLSRIPDLVRKIQSKGIQVTGSFMVGFPHETKEQIDTTFQRATELNMDSISISIVNPLPGTGLYEECEREGLFHDDFDPQEIRWSRESIKLDGVPRGYLAEKRREVWREYMSDRLDIQNHELNSPAVAKVLGDDDRGMDQDYIRDVVRRGDASD